MTGPTKVGRRYARRLREWFAPLQSVIREFVAVEIRVAFEIAPRALHADGFSDVVKSLISRASALFTAKAGRFALEAMSRAAVDGAAEQNRADLAKKLGGIVAPDPEGWLADYADDATRDLVSKVDAAKNVFFGRLETTIGDGLRQGQTEPELRKTIVSTYGTSRPSEPTELDRLRRRSRAIADDGVFRVYGETNRVRQKRMGLPAYVWRTKLDERVRPAHRAREGRAFLWSDPPFDGPPGIPPNCRCHAEPVLDDQAAGADAGA